MIKRILAILLALALSCGMSLVFADAELGTISDVNLVYNAREHSIRVEGAVSSSRANATLIFRLIDTTADPDADVMVDFTSTKLVGNVVRFDFGEIKMPEIAGADYTLEISGAKLSKYTTTFSYGSLEQRVALLEAVRDAASSDTATMGSVVGVPRNAQILGVDVSGYNSIKDKADGALEFEYLMKNDATYTVPAADDEEGIIEAMDYVKEKYDGAVAGAKFMVIKDSDDWQTWYDTYYKDFGFEVEEDADDTPSIARELYEVIDEGELIERLAEFDGKKTIAEIKAYICDSVLLTQIKIGTDSKVEKIFKNFSDEYFKGEGWEINWSDYRNLKNGKDKEVIGSLRGGDFETCKAAVSEFNRLIEEKKGGVSTGGVDRVPSDRNNGSTGARPVVLPSDETEEIPTFSDIDDVPWAKNAIEFLYEKKVVNGNPDGTFAPNNNVTRAEFIKMVVESMGVGSVYDKTPFLDVAPDSWYATYIARAYKEGIALGDDSGRFYPEEPITRQDMVTILYRALGADETGDISFTDSGSISDYAKTAVGYFASKGIVNGVGNGLFAPLNNATRAETAVIIYRIVTSK